jgi:predicted Zn-dependent peptidase
VSAGVWVLRGAAHELPEIAGATHLLEHLMLRRCGQRTHREVARLIDRLGGAVDAWTDQEMTGLSVETTAGGAAEAVALLCDAVTSPTFDPGDVELERQVAMAELEMIADDPGELADEALGRAAWGDHPLARPIIGTEQSLIRLSPATLQHHHPQLVRPGQVLAVVAGDLCPDDVERWFARLPLDQPPSLTPLPQVAWRGERVGVTRQAQGQFTVRLAVSTPGLLSAEVPAVSLLNRVLGVGASSRLFQRLREELGLVYDISSGLLLRSEAGRLEVAWSCSPDHLERTRREVIDQLTALTESVGPEEVAIARDGMLRSLEMDFDDPTGRCELEAGEVLQTGRVLDLERRCRELERVDAAELRRLAQRLLAGAPMAEAWCGPPRECERVA